ncbi:MAG: hemerythrin domain-containing protein [Deltaproteobacteria bacterium]|nr:hemerythrin domain-containing protein [Deltaproteobacteria bacterium]
MNTVNHGYLSKLMEEHKTFRQLLEEIKTLTSIKDFNGIASRVGLLKRGLASHAKKEEEKLYVELLEAAKRENMALIQSTINTFSNAMNSIAARSIDFFDKYSNGGEIEKSLSPFASNFTAIQRDILMRLESEEKALYSMYEKYCC